MKKLLFACLLFSLNVGASPFTDGTVLTAAALNSAFGNAAITSGAIVGATSRKYVVTITNIATPSVTITGVSSAGL